MIYPSFSVHSAGTSFLYHGKQKAKENPTILKMDYKMALSKLKETGERFDIIFLDPPYKSDFGNKSIKIIFDNDLLSDDGILIYECEKGTTVDSAGFEIFDEKTYGTIKVVFCKKVGN